MEEDLSRKANGKGASLKRDQKTASMQSEVENARSKRQHYEEAIENAKARLDFDNAIVNTVMKRLKRRCLLTDTNVQVQVENSLSEFVKQNIDPGIRAIILDDNLEKSKETYYQQPETPKRERDEVMELFIEVKEFEEDVDSIIKHVYKGEGIISFKSTCVRNFLKYIFCRRPSEFWLDR